jgi:hypothetical protein
MISGEGRDSGDIWKLSQWGRAGAAALGRVRAAAKEPGAEALATWLAAAESGDIDAVAGDDEAQRAALVAEIVPILPLQPVSATGTRDSVLMGMQVYELRDLLSACRRKLPGGGAGCLMVVADLVPELPGEEAVLGMEMDGWASLDGVMVKDGALYRQGMRMVDGQYLETEAVRLLMAEWQVTPPALAPLRLNQLGTGATGLFMTP